MSKYYCQVAGIRGNVIQLAGIRGTPYRESDIDAPMLLNDFYTMVMKDSDGNKGIRKSDIKATFTFISEAERDNFIDYLKTDFARFCLSIFKINSHLDNGELELIPWLDFTEEWDDAKLYKHFNINKETQAYITSFLPDFHGIRQ